MKIISAILCCLFMVTTPIFSQVKMGKEWRQHQDFYNKTFGKEDPDFKITKAPEIFKDAPVVILSQKLYLGFFWHPLRVNFGNVEKASGLLKGVVHKRILIQQESAIADFSEYYFGQSEVMGIQLIKADGSKQIINLQEAIAVTTEVPKFYRSDFQNTKYYKIAISNLEVGDILDFYTIFQEDHFNNSSSFVTTLSGTYPIANSKVLFDIEEKWSFYYKSINGANAFEEIKLGAVNAKGKPSDKVRRFAVVQKNIPSQKSERWDYPYLNEPTIKIITFKNTFNATISSAVSFKDIPAPENKPANYSTYAITPIFHPLKTKGNKELRLWKFLPKEQAINNLYHYLRYCILPKNGRDLEHLEETSEQDNYAAMSSGFFAANFRSALEEFHIESELVYAVPEYCGALDQSIALEERAIGVYIPDTDKYYFAPDNYSKPGEIPTYLSNATFLRIPLEYKMKQSDLFAKATKGNLPKYTSKENLFAAKLELDLSDDFSQQIGTVNLSLNNRYRRTYSSMFLNNLDYYKTEKAFFKLDGKAKKKNKKEMKTENKAVIMDKERDKLRLNAIKRHFEVDYSIKELADCKVINDGRFDDNPLEVQLDFTSENLVKKAGKNYIFSVGSLIGEQVELDQTEISERTKDIHFGTAKFITNDINVKIPSTYKVEGLDNLRFTVDNEYMTFISTAKMVDNTLVITTKKDYKKAMVPKSDWSKVVAVLEAAYEFTQAKVVLKKNDEGTAIEKE